MAATAATTTTATAVSQLSCFSSINRKLHLHRRRSILSPSPRRHKLPLVMSLGEEHGSRDTYTADEPASSTEEAAKKCPFAEQQHVAAAEEHRRASAELGKAYGTAKIHDFCFGIPYGGLILSGGLLGFIFSRNPTTLSTGVLFGSGLLALSTSSLKIWRQGKSSFPYILGQAVLSAALVWKNIQAYSLTKKIFPTAFYAIISAAMLGFYSYVMISGGNPPPKKLHSSATVEL